MKKIHGRPHAACLVTLAFILVSRVPAAGEEITLDRALELATGKSLRVWEAQSEIEARRAALARQQTYLYPTVRVTGNYSYYRRPGDPLAAFGPAFPVEGDSTTFGVGLSQPLYTGGALQERSRLAARAVEMAGVAREQVLLDLEYRVSRAYIEALRAGQAVVVSAELVENRVRHLADVTVRVREGFLPPVEQLRAEVELADSRNRLLAAENAARAAHAALNRLLERPADRPLELVDLPPGPPPARLEFYLAEARDSRPETSLARLDTAQAQAEVRLARSGYFPEVSLNLAREYLQDDAFRSRWRDQDRLTVMFSWDVWNRGRVSRQVEQGRRRVEQSRLAATRLERDILLEVSNAYLEMVTARSRVEAVEKAVVQAREVLRLQRLRFAEGLATSTEVMDAELALAQAEHNYHHARYDVLTAEAALRRSAGLRREAALPAAAAS